MKKIALISILLVCAVAAMTPQEAGGLVIERVLNGDTEAKRVYVYPDSFTGGEIEFWHNSITLPDEPGYFVFVDDYPAANWEHAARAFFVAEDGRITTWNVSTPPRYIQDDLVELTDGRIYDGLDHAEYHIPTLEEVQPARAYLDTIIPQPGDRAGVRYALLMSGGASQGNNHIRYWNDMAFMYWTLINVYGYDENDIFVLMSDGDDPAVDRSDGTNSPTDLDGDGDQDYEDPCTRTYVFQYLDNLAATVTTNDSLFIFTTDHGGGASDNVYLNLWNFEELQDDEFAAELDTISFSQCIITMEQCFSGGFIDDIQTTGTENVVISTSSNGNEYSWAMPPYYYYDTYVYFWTAGVNGEFPGWPVDMGGGVSDADADDDGTVTAHEGYIYALAEDFSDEHPQYYDASGIGDDISLWGAGLGPRLRMTYYEVLGDEGDALLVPGENADVSVTLKNTGGEIATNVVAILSSDDADIEVTVGEIDYGSLDPDQESEGPNPFEITVSSFAKDPYVFYLNCDVTADGDIHETFPITVTVGSVYGFYDDIESGEGDWVHSGDVDLWHIEDYRSHTPVNSWKCGGEDDGDYESHMNCYIYSPMILVGLDAPQLDFYAFYKIAPGDGCRLEFGDDTRAWDELEVFYGTQQDWMLETFDLTDYAGTIGQFRFNFYSNGTTEREGFYFDDFEVSPPDVGIELVNFAVESTDAGALVSWTLGDGDTTAGFDVYRQDGVLVDSMVLATGDRNPLISLNSTPIPGGGSNYRYLDMDVTSGGDYLYYLKATDTDGTLSLFGPVEFHYDAEAGSRTTEFNAPFPNPASGEVTFAFSLAVDGRASLAVYDLAGRRVATLTDTELAAGRHEIAWDASGIASGAYIVRLVTDGKTLNQRLVISR
ncbi:MAG: T9SS type A sorting domain-containing protein [bacterium]|nr:T9SS type A sorting domain-containing protein [bacterium]